MEGKLKTMKLVAIQPISYVFHVLQMGKIYEGELTPTIYDPQTLKPAEPSYIIKCDDGKYRKFMAKHFITLEEWRERQLDKIL